MIHDVLDAIGHVQTLLRQRAPFEDVHAALDAWERVYLREFPEDWIGVDMVRRAVVEDAWSQLP